MYWATTTRRLLWGIAVVAAFFVPPAFCDTLEREDTLGRKYAEEVKREYKIVTDAAMVNRVQHIGDELAAIACQLEVPAGYGSSEVCKFNYEFTVIEDADPNAFSVPGGKIFVNTGLLKLATTDDELAGVIAHEIAHAAHHHVAKIISQQSKIDQYMALVALLGIMTNARSKDLNNVLLGVSMLRQGQVSGYTMQAERDADKTAVAYLAKSSFNPLGMVEFMQKLDDLHTKNPTLPLGIYQTHPAPFRRVASIRKAVLDAGIKVDMRKLRGIVCANSAETSPGSGQYNVVICGKVLYDATQAGGKSSSKSHADSIAEAVNDMLDNDIRPEQILVDETHNCLTAKGKVLLKLEASDIPAGSDARALLNRARKALLRAAWADWLITTCEARQDMEP